MRRLFKIFARRAGKSQPAPPPAGDSPEDWKPGDLAECVAVGRWALVMTNEIAAGPAYRQVLMVEQVHLAPHVVSGEPLQWLVFRRFGDGLFAAMHFRKITPRADSCERGAADTLDELLTIGLPVPADIGEAA